MTTVRRFDAARAGKAVRMDNGWLRAPATLTRTGVFAYRTPDGSVRRELRLPEEVFHPEAIASFEAAPVVIDHPVGQTPQGLLNAETAQRLTVGAIGTPRQDGDDLVATMLVHDASGVAAIDAGKVEVSCGYVCDLDETPGTYRGQRYDAVQRRIRGNHVALVDRGRAGNARVHLDNADAVQVVLTPEQDPERPHMAHIRIDGIAYEAPEQTAAAIEKALDAAAKAAEAIKVETTKAQARADAAEAELAKAREALTAATDPKALRAKIAERVQLEAKAREVLGGEVKLDELDDAAIKRAMLGKLLPAVKLDGRDDVYVAAALDAALAIGPQSTPARHTARYDGADVKADGSGGARVDPVSAAAKFEAAKQAAATRPLAASK